MHASTLEVLDQIGLAESVLALPHSKLHQLRVQTPQKAIDLVNFEGLPNKYPYVAVMPQAQFLELLCGEAERDPNFRCIGGASAQGLLESERPQALVGGVHYRDLQEQGLPEFRQSLHELAHWLGDRVDLVQDWDALHLLNIQSDCLELVQTGATDARRCGACDVTSGRGGY